MTVQTEDKAAIAPGTLDVRIVGVAEPLRVNVVSVGGDTLSKVGSQVVLPVGVHNTVETKIVSPMFSSGFKDGVGVVILKH